MILYYLATLAVINFHSQIFSTFQAFSILNSKISIKKYLRKDFHLGLYVVMTE